MTEYCTIDQLHEIGIRAEALARVQPSKKRAAIQAASGKIDSYLHAVFTLPLVNAGTDLARCCAIIAAYDLMSAEGLIPEGGDENMLKRYDRELDWLALISKGVVKPASAAGQPVAAEGSFRSRAVSSPSRGYSTRGTGCDPGPFQGS